MTDLTPHLQMPCLRNLVKHQTELFPSWPKQSSHFSFIHFPPGLNLSIPVKKGKSFFPILIKEHLHICTSAPCSPCSAFIPRCPEEAPAWQLLFPQEAHTQMTFPSLIIPVSHIKQPCCNELNCMHGDHHPAVETANSVILMPHRIPLQIPGCAASMWHCSSVRALEEKLPIIIHSVLLAKETLHHHNCGKD